MIAIGSLLALLLSGAYMTAQMSGWAFGWPKVAVAAMVLIAPIGAATGRRMRSTSDALIVVPIQAFIFSLLAAVTKLPPTNQACSVDSRALLPTKAPKIAPKSKLVPSNP